MRRQIATVGVVMLVAACGPKAGGTGATGGGSEGAHTEGSTASGSVLASTSATVGGETDVVYRVSYYSGTSPWFYLVIDKARTHSDYCVQLSFWYPHINNSGQFGIEFPPDPNWAVNWPPHVVASAECYSEDDSDDADVLAAEGRVWWDEGMCVVDADVVLTLPADPRWPAMERISFEGLPVEGREAECAAGGDTGTGG
ncbi:MAG: hypothetical protein D6705_17195 [Deltaproteobacteria bacterium]|nr:MAG: hypothetical protein D6705_17195 [Deltaproteobacteria bacterium]